MCYKIEVRPLATLEVIEAYDWYELQQEELGLSFLNELESFYKALLRNPSIFSFYDEPAREGRISRFPYLVIYEIIEPDKIIVYSVFMAKQSPSRKRTFKNNQKNPRQKSTGEIQLKTRLSNQTSIGFLAV